MEKSLIAYHEAIERWHCHRSSEVHKRYQLAREKYASAHEGARNPAPLTFIMSFCFMQKSYLVRGMCVQSLGGCEPWGTMLHQPTMVTPPSPHARTPVREQIDSILQDACVVRVNRIGYILQRYRERASKHSISNA
jgi:hypothetical protein